MTKVVFDDNKQGIYIEIHHTGKVYDLKVISGIESYHKFKTVYEDSIKSFHKKNSLSNL